jgi:hypothetical protein
MAGIPAGGFSNKNGLEDWFNGLSGEQLNLLSCIIALRVALRSLPSIHHFLNNPKASQKSSLVLANFRAGAISRVACRHPGNFGELLAKPAELAGSWAGTMLSQAAAAGTMYQQNVVLGMIGKPHSQELEDSFEPDRATARALHTASGVTSLFSYAVYDIVPRANRSQSEIAKRFAEAIDACFFAVAKEIDHQAYWGAITSDVVALEISPDPQLVMTSKVWLADPPLTWLEGKRRFQFALTELDRSEQNHFDSWRIWADWYDDALAGLNSFGLADKQSEAIDLRIAKGGDNANFWFQMPTEINAEIANWVQEARANTNPAPEQSTILIPDGGFENNNQLEAWLNNLPEEHLIAFARVIAHRSAVRAMTAPAHAILRNGSDPLLAQLAMQVFRANITNRCKLKYGSAEIEQALLREVSRKVSDAATASPAGLGQAHEKDAGYAASNALTAVRNNEASEVVESAIYAVTRASSAVSEGVITFWHSVTEDARALEHNRNAQDLLNSRLWLNRPPNFRAEELEQLLHARTAFGIVPPVYATEKWKISVEWLVSIEAGAQSFGLPDALAEKIDLQIMGGGGRKGFWDREPEEVYAEIAQWVSEARSLSRSLSISQLGIPKTAPASVRPQWTNGKLRNRRGVEALISSEAQAAALSAHRDELLTLARKTKGKNSVETEARALISDTARLISSSGQVSRKGLFRLGIKLEILMEYSETVNRDWPDALARSYKGNILGLDKTLDQFNELVEFRRNAATAELDGTLASLDAQSVRQVAEALGTGESTKFVDKGLISDIEASAELLAFEAVRSDGEVTPHAQHDALEGANNLFKELAIKAQQGGPVEAGQAAYKDGFASKYIKASRQAGEQDAEKAAAWANRTLLSSEMLGAAARHLAHRYPKRMGWLNRIWGDEGKAAAAGGIIEHQPHAGKADDAPH